MCNYKYSAGNIYICVTYQMNRFCSIIKEIRYGRGLFAFSNKWENLISPKPFGVTLGPLVQ
jgi:hypothetical protein